jgi:hypothetical protein
MLSPRRMHAAALVAALLFPSGISAANTGAFTAFQVWDTDSGDTWRRLGLQMTGWYLIQDNPHRLRFIPVRNVWGVSRALLAPAGDLVAYASFGVNGAKGSQVTVADTSGQVAANFPGAERFAWDATGQSLALLYSHEDIRTDFRGEKQGAADSVVIWRRSDSRKRSFLKGPMTFEWGGDTLFLGYPNSVEALDSKTGEIRRTSHRWAVISPDGRYSLLKDELQAEGFRCIEEKNGIEVSGCVRELLEFGSYFAEPFWVSGRGASHLLCVSACSSHSSVPMSHCGSVIVDTRSLEVLQSIAGKVIAPSCDGKALIVLRGDTIKLVTLGPWKRAREDGPMVRVRVELQGWGGGESLSGHPAPRPAKQTRFYDVRVGDWIPMSLGSCDKFFHVEKVLGGDSISVRFRAGLFTDKSGRAVLSRTPRTFRTASVDGGSDVTLSVAR